MEFKLKHTDRYELIKTYFTGKLEDGGGCACQNCNRIITSVAVVKDTQGKQWHIGMDCAETLTSIGKLESWTYEKMAMKDAIAIAKNVVEMSDNGTLKIQYPDRGVFVAGEIEVKKKGVKVMVKYVRNIWETSVLSKFPDKINDIFYSVNKTKQKHERNIYWLHHEPQREIRNKRNPYTKRSYCRNSANG